MKMRKITSRRQNYINSFVYLAALSLVYALLILLPTFAENAQVSNQPSIMEAYPDRIQTRIEAMRRLFAEQSENLKQGGRDFTPQFVMDISRKWNPGQVLKVGFRGGTSDLRQKVEKAAQEWSQYCNIAFDFRDGGNFREWSTSDADYKADVRISFDQDGYWSLIGRDSITPSVISPQEASMNFGGFASFLPSDYATTVKHEFGHALAFEHEHQSPLNGCDHDFKWEDDPGYVPTRDNYGQFVADSDGKQPGIYTVLGGPPNSWPKAKVDFNLRQLPESHAYKVGPFDVTSIMKYYFPAWMFVAGTESHCYSLENLEISSGDREGAASVYPKTKEDIEKVIRTQKAVLDTVLRMDGLLPAVRDKYKLQRNSSPQ